MKDNNKNDIKIKQINPRTELNDLEKTAILQFELEEKMKEEELSKTQQFKILNSRRKKDNLDMPKLKNNNDDFELPKPKINLTDTIKIKLSDLRETIEKESDDKKQKKSLYDTVILKLDDIINKKKGLKIKSEIKVVDVEQAKIIKKFHFFKPKDITKSKNIHINVDSEEFGRQLYNLNRIALIALSEKKPEVVRKYSYREKLNRIEKVRVSKHNYLKYQKDLNKFAINKLYYKIAPKETKKYILYKYSVMLSSCVFVITSLIIVNWFIQGFTVNHISHSLVEETPITETNDGDLVNIDEPAPTPEKKDEYSNKNTMYWKYLNTQLTSVDFTELSKQNKDTVGWIIVNNTNVNYPVVQTKNNDYYLTHAFDKSRNSAGWVFADFRDDFDILNQNMVIYAHGRKDKVMFGSLTNTLNSKWYKNQDNQIIQLSTKKYNTMWQIFSIYKIKAESYYITTDFASDESFETFVKTMKSRSIYNFGIDVTKNDKLLTLSTCYNDNGIRLVVQAKLVKIQER